MASTVAPDANRSQSEHHRGSSTETVSSGSGDVVALPHSSSMADDLSVDVIDYRDRDRGEETSNACTEVPALARFCTPKWFTFFLCVFVAVQGSTVTGLGSATLSSIETRYQLSSTTLGFISSSYDMFVLVVVMFIGYHGGKGHTPRWLGSGLVVLAVGAFLYSSPQYFSGKYDSTPSQDLGFFCHMTYSPDCGDSGTSLLFLFFFGQACIAWGSAALYTLGPSYLDKIVDKSVLSLYLAAFYAVSALGPAVGFLLAGALLDTYVDGESNNDHGIQPEDEKWVGAWWLGYLVMSILGLAFAVPLFCYPHYLPGTEAVREENKRQSAVLRLRQLSTFSLENPNVARPWWKTARDIVTNKPFIFNCFGQATEAFAVSGFAAFLPKTSESMFGLTSSEASFTVGLVIIPGAAGGIFFGGWLMRRLKVRAVETARWTWMIALVALVFMFTFFIGCDTIDLVGVTRGYRGTVLGGFSGDKRLDDTCNMAGEIDVSGSTWTCPLSSTCDEDDYDPVCGSDGYNYFNGCYAGCWNRTGDRYDQSAEFSNCACITDGARASRGKCDNGCNTLPIYLLGIFLAMFFTFMNNVPATTVILRSTTNEQRSFAMSIQNLIFRIAGSIPAPIVFGALIDKACLFFATSCGDELGNCAEYDTTEMRNYFVILAVVPKFLSFCMFFLSWYFFRDAAEVDADEERSEAIELPRSLSDRVLKQDVQASDPSEQRSLMKDEDE